MPATLLTLRTDLRNRINDPDPGTFWGNSELNSYLNEGTRDVARRGEVLQELDPIRVASGQNMVYLADDLGSRVHRVTFVADNSPTLTYTLEPSNHYNMDQNWGLWQSLPRNYPGYFVLWGTPGVASKLITLQLYPTPATSGALNVFYYALPKQMVADTDVCEIPEGWHDMVVLYAEYVARRKDHDPTWQEAKQLYEQSLNDLVERSRHWHDQGAQVSMQMSTMMGGMWGEWF